MVKKQGIFVLYIIFANVFADDSGSTCNCGHNGESSENSDQLVITFNPKTKIHAAFNETANMVPVLDSTYNISALYNGKTGAALVFNYETGISAFIPRGSEITWYSEKRSFDEYFKNLPSQMKLYQYGESHGIRFDPTSITDEISDQIVEVLASMSSDYASRCEALATYLHVSKITGDYFKTSLSAYSDVAGLVNTPFRGDFKWLIGMYQGLGGFFDEIEGGMATLAKNNVTVDMSKFFTGESGIHVLIYLLELLHEKFDLAKMLGKSLNSADRFFTLLEKLSGEVEYGFDGYIHVIAEIVRFKFNESSIQNVEIILRKYSQNPKTSSSEVQEKSKVYFQDLLKAIQKLKLEEPFKGLVKILTDISKGKWIVGKTNMSQVLNIVMNMEPSGDKDSVKQVLKLLQGEKIDAEKPYS